MRDKRGGLLIACLCILLRKFIIVSRFSVRLSFLALSPSVYNELINVNFLTTLKKLETSHRSIVLDEHTSSVLLPRLLMAYHPKTAFTVISAFSSRRQYSSYNTAMLTISGYQVHVKHYYFV